MQLNTSYILLQKFVKFLYNYLQISFYRFSSLPLHQSSANAFAYV